MTQDRILLRYSSTKPTSHSRDGVSLFQEASNLLFQMERSLCPVLNLRHRRMLYASTKSHRTGCAPKCPVFLLSISNWGNSNLIFARADSHICLDVSGYKSCIVIVRALVF